MSQSSADSSDGVQVLEVTGKAAEQRMGQDFADAYEGSELYR